jgi:hypothetical protein
LALAILEKVADRRAEHLAYVVQATSANPVRAVLVFLDLLKRDSQLLSQSGLAQADLISA